MGVAYRVMKLVGAPRPGRGAPTTTIDRGHGFLGACARAASVLLPLSLALALTIAFSCGGSSATDTVQSSGQVRGLVVEVVSRSITEVDSLRIRDEAEDVWTFVADEGFIGISPSHVREHQLLGQTVLVTYESRGDSLVAVNISD